MGVEVKYNPVWFGTVTFGYSFVLPVNAGRLKHIIMYTGTYAPWEHYPKNLRHYEVEDPMSVVVDFFSCDSVKGHSKRLKEWRYYVVNDEHYDEKRHGPGTLLFVYDMNLKFLEALYLLLYNYNENSYKRKQLSEDQLEIERTEWEFYPNNLSLKEQLEPYKVVKKAFKEFKPQAYRDYLHEWVHSALYIRPDTEGLYAGEIIAVYEILLKLYSAAWLIFMRESGKASQRQLTLNKNQTIPVSGITELRSIEPRPSAAEVLALEEIKKVILERCPDVRLIVHLGTDLKTSSFFLLILIADEYRAVENEISNKIEDNCRHLAVIHAMVHKLNSAKEALNMGRRFWLAAMTKGIVLYQFAELTLPEYNDVTNEAILARAKFHWERWGVQGKAFLTGAETYLSVNNSRLAAFMLHQSMEAVLKAIIQAVIGYRVQMHNLTRLLRLTLLFTDDLWAVFELNKAERKEEFALLQAAYSLSRYNNQFDPEQEAVSKLAAKVTMFTETAEAIYQHFLKDNQEAAVTEISK